MNEQELVEAPTGIELFKAFADPIAELRELSVTAKVDLTTYEGEVACKDCVDIVGKLRIGVEKLRKSLKKEYLDKGREVDAEAKVWQADIAEIDAIYSKPLKALETKRLNEMMAIQEAEKKKARAEQAAKDAELEELRAYKAQQDAQEQAEANTQQIEADKEQAVQNALDAERRAHQEKNDRIARELQEKNDADARRQADVEHRREINNLAAEEINAIVHKINGSDDLELSIAIVTAIAQNKIPNITINY